MRNKTAKSRRYSLTGAALTCLVLATLSACSVGAGAPDGWRYLRADPLAVAVPKTWQDVRGGAVLRGPDGRTDAEVAVSANPGAGGPPDKATATALATARKESLDFDGQPGQVLSYVQAAPDGRPAARVEVRLHDYEGHPVTVRAWTADGAADPMLLRRIINSIEFATDPNR
ncbi:hypothetical protein ACIOC1_08155 [Streptomyces sp. NPDC088197]|uniref:hypothetical protein n=1 Tax=unclassified Streptomyces TaxID=2593676 RepID=UPI0036E4E3D5